MKKKTTFGLKEIIIIVVVTSIITSLTTGVIMYNNSRITNSVSNVDLNNDENLKEFIKVYASLIGNYYTTIDKKVMLEQAIRAMFTYLGEDYSDYLNKNETDELAEKLQGEYTGIGIQIIEGNIIYAVFNNSPAKEVGLLPGDVILKINEEDVIEKSTTDISNMIQKVSGGKISLLIKRNNEEKSFVVEVKTMMVPAVHYQMVENETKKTGYLAITTFSSTVTAQVKEALANLERDGMDSLILDVRGNTGGYLSAANEIASIFLEKGKVIYSLAEKDSTKTFKDETDEKRDYPIIILMNDGSASSSEILAAALKDSYGAKLVGEISYGKGKVQQTKTLEDGTMVKYTTARWIRPNGDCIDGIGLIPDEEVVLDLPTDGTEIIDSQLKKALEMLQD